MSLPLFSISEVLQLVWRPAARVPLKVGFWRNDGREDWNNALTSVLRLYLLGNLLAGSWHVSGSNSMIPGRPIGAENDGLDVLECLICWTDKRTAVFGFPSGPFDWSR